MTDFEVECRARVDQLRTAFVELYDSCGVDPASPQDVSRTLRVNKTLAWNVARLMQAADSLAAVSHVPGASSLERVIQATQRHGAGADTVAKARTAAADFHKMIEDHAGDRPTLDLIIDSTGTVSNSRLELSRKLAFRGNSGLYGVQARTRVLCNFIAPNADDPTKLDMASVSGYVGFRRLRPNVRWPMFMIRTWSEGNDQLAGTGWEPLEESDQSALGFPMMPSFCRGNLPEIQAVTEDGGRDFVLGDGPLGNEGAFDCYSGEMMRMAAARYESRGDDIGEFGASISTPVEYLVSDILVDESLSFALKPELLVFGRIFAAGRPTGSRDDPSLLPIHQSTVELPGSPPLVNTALIPGYPQLVKQVYQRMGWSPERFKGTRLMLKYPPLGSNVILRFPLPTQPTD